jgi:hypothetical protein
VIPACPPRQAHCGGPASPILRLGFFQEAEARNPSNVPGAKRLIGDGDEDSKAGTTDAAGGQFRGPIWLESISELPNAVIQ